MIAAMGYVLHPAQGRESQRPHWVNVLIQDIIDVIIQDISAGKLIKIGLLNYFIRN